uniref:Uncharacterized protein n=1 Tax=Lepeophtheirus salmonis TaxID=72036 RepID=A0A0K2SWP7_LEPSM
MMARLSDECNKPFLWSPNSFDSINPSPYTSNLNAPQNYPSQSTTKTAPNTSELNELQASLSPSVLKTFNEIFVSLSSLQKKNTDLEILLSKYKAKSKRLEHSIYEDFYNPTCLTQLYVLVVLAKLLTWKWMKKLHNL